MPPADGSRFHRGFRRWSGYVRRRLASGAALAGLTVGMGVAGIAAALAWWWRLDELRPWTAAFGALGALLALGWAARRRWSDTEVALYLDARLGGDEAISTAVELTRRAAASDASHAITSSVIDRATELLAQATTRRVRPRLLHRSHALALLGAGAVAAMSLAPLPPPPPEPPTPPGAELVRTERLQGLEKLIGLEQLDARDAAQRERLDDIARRARDLRAELARGLPKREAQARLAELRDAIAQERLSLGDQRGRAGLDAAVRKLGGDARLQRAAEALGAGDLTEFDREMQRLASQAEAEARAAAKEALEQAERAARERGALPLADALSRQRELFAEQESRAEALRELGERLREHLDDAARRDLEEFGEQGDPEVQQRLAEALAEALEGLEPEERERLAERLGRALERDGDLSPLTREQLEQLAEQLASPEGRDALRRQLEQLGRQPPSEDAERERGLSEAERGGADAERELGLVPLPSPGSPATGHPGDGTPSDGKGGTPKAGSPGSNGDGGEAAPDHHGQTADVPADPLRAKARPRLDPTAPLHRSTEGRTHARPGETADQQGTGVLGSVSDAELDAVERSEVPQEYREQVGRYFRP